MMADHCGNHFRLLHCILYYKNDVDWADPSIGSHQQNKDGYHYEYYYYEQHEQRESRDAHSRVGRREPQEERWQEVHGLEWPQHLRHGLGEEVQGLPGQGCLGGLQQRRLECSCRRLQCDVVSSSFWLEFIQKLTLKLLASYIMQKK